MKMPQYNHFICHFYCHFLYFPIYSYRQDMTFGRSLTTSSDFSLKSYHAAFSALFLTLSIISMAFAVCIPKENQKDFRFPVPCLYP